MERVTGIEPVPVAWKATVLPLNYTRKVPALPCTGVGGKHRWRDALPATLTSALYDDALSRIQWGGMSKLIDLECAITRRSFSGSVTFQIVQRCPCVQNYQGG